MSGSDNEFVFRPDSGNARPIAVPPQLRVGWFNRSDRTPVQENRAGHH
jgi:hypothetical protein